MGTLHSFIEPFLSALNQAASHASAALEANTRSSKQFYNNCEQLVGDNSISFQGLGAQAFYNVFSVNDQHSQMLIAKIHDLYNASHNLPPQVEEVTNEYDNLNKSDYYASLGGSYAGDMVLGKFLWPGAEPVDILQRLRDSFVAHAQLDNVLDPVMANSEIFFATNWERGNLMNQIDTNHQHMVDNMQHDIKAHPNSSSLDQYSLQNINQEHEEARWVVQTLVDNMNSQLLDWAMALRTLVMSYYTEVLNASKVDQPTVADIVYELNLPQYKDTPVLIYQLPNGGLLVAVKGGDPGKIESEIRKYMADYNIPLNTPITIMGYENGTSVAQKIIEDATNGSTLPFKVENAILVGGKLPDPGTIPVNYIVYQEMPGEDKRPWWKPTPEQLTLMALTAVVGVATDGFGDIALAPAGEAITGAFVTEKFTEIFGDLAKEKITEYAMDLGYNATHPEKLSMEEFIAKKIQNSSAYTSADSVVVQLPGQDPLPLQQYVKQQISQGNTVDLKKLNAKFYYHYMNVLPEEPNLNKGVLSNDAFLGSQSILDPKVMSNTTLGVAPIQGPISPPATGN